MSIASRASLFAVAVAAGIVLAGCAANETTGDANLVAGKQLFVQRCGSCHVMGRAGTKGVTGPNLDTALANPLGQGFGESAVRGMVLNMIDIGSASGTMLPDIVEGEEARDVAAYVATAVAKPGEDEGLLATAVAPQGSDKPAVAKNGTLTIPADPNGQLRFVNSTAMAPPGELTISMPNMSGVPHNIAIDGKGSSDIIEKGESSFTAMFAAGEYEYVCEVEGHLAAGMKGTLTVK